MALKENFEAPYATVMTVRDKIKPGKSSQSMVRPGGIEPPAFGTGIRRSIRLSYERIIIKTQVPRSHPCWSK